MYVDVLPAYLSVQYVCEVPRESRRGLWIPKFLLWTVLSYHVSARNLPQVLWNGRQYLQPLSHLSSSMFKTLKNCLFFYLCFLNIQCFN